MLQFVQKRMGRAIRRWRRGWPRGARRGKTEVIKEDWDGTRIWVNEFQVRNGYCMLSCIHLLVICQETLCSNTATHGLIRSNTTEYGGTHLNCHIWLDMLLYVAILLRIGDLSY